MTSRYTCREAECLNCRNNLQEGKEERMSFAGDGGESTLKRTENTRRETLQEEEMRTSGTASTEGPWNQGKGFWIFLGSYFGFLSLKL